MLELHWRGHDGVPLQALLARPVFRAEDSPIRLRLAGYCESESLDCEHIAAGGSELVFAPPPNRRLEDRVLDVLRLICCVSTLDGVEPHDVQLAPPEEVNPADELLIAERLREENFC